MQEEVTRYMFSVLLIRAINAEDTEAD